MNFRIASLILFFCISVLFFSFQQIDLLPGKWRNKKYGVEVIIYKKKNKYFGNVTEAGNKKGNDKLKKGEVMQILQNFVKTSDSTYCCGTIYIPKTKTTLQSTIQILDKNNLVVTGYVFGFKTSSKWVRIKK